MTNNHDYAITFDRVRYEVVMNNVTVGQGTADGFAVSAGDTRRVTVQTALDTGKIGDWWTTHLRRGEETTVVIRAYGTTEVNGEQRRVPVDLIHRKVKLETDFLGGNGTTVTNLEPTKSGGFTAPRMTGMER